MKRTYILLSYILCLTPALAQDYLKINDLFIPSSPGFVLADKSPSSIEKPTTPKTFGVSLLNLWQGGAVEATPFWFSNKPQFTYEDWIKKKITFLETFNISAATFKTDTTTALSIGFRTQLFRIYSKNYVQTILAKEGDIITALTTKDSGGNLDLNKIKRESENLEKLEAKGLLAMEIAGAIIGSSKNNSFRNLASEKSGIWTNLRWSPGKSALDFVALARYSWANNVSPKSGSDSAFFDYGLSLNYQNKSFNLAVEYVSRRDISIKKNYDRFTLTAIYQLNDNLAFVASVGKNFTKVDNIITIFGINIGITNQKLDPSQ